MSITANVPAARDWVRLHRAALVILVLCMALAATLGLLAARAFTGSNPVPATSVTTGHVPPPVNPCLLDRPGRPIPC
jgi:hypothetical protein